MNPAIVAGGTLRAPVHTQQGCDAPLPAVGGTAPWRDRMRDFDGPNAATGTPDVRARGRRYDGR